MRVSSLLPRAATAAAALIATAAAGTASAQTITGAGSSFAAPLYQKWAQEYKNSGGAQVNYQPIGSSGGIKNIIAHAVDFGGTDGPMTAEQIASAPGILHIPVAAGAVVLAYNVPGVPDHLKLTGPVVADMFLGKVTKWNDPEIARLNPGENLPATSVIPFHRSDGSGTTNIFTNYLGQISADWRGRVGVGQSVRWPVGLGGKGNAGVTALIKQTAGGIGYIELAYAETNRIPFASVRNQKGAFVVPSLQSTTIAAEGAKLPADFRAIITNTAAPKGYPITGYTWALVYRNAKTDVKKFFVWALTQGQKTAGQYQYSSLPENVRKRALTEVEAIR